MGATTNISWTDATWNVAVGCKKVDSDCKNCYMYRESLAGTRYDPKTIRKTKGGFNMPNKLKKPSLIFTSSLTDFFIEEIDGYREECWEIIRRNPRHIFQILTKRPERIASNLPSDWGTGYPNVWLGTSVGSEASIDRIVELIHVPAQIRFLSLEPLHGPIALTSSELGYIGDSPIHWVIIGGESGNMTGRYKARPCELTWIESLVRTMDTFRIPVFIKQLGTVNSKAMGLKHRHGADITEWPEYLQRQEFPAAPGLDQILKGRNA